MFLMVESADGTMLKFHRSSLITILNGQRILRLASESPHHIICCSVTQTPNFTISLESSTPIRWNVDLISSIVRESGTPNSEVEKLMKKPLVMTLNGLTNILEVSGGFLQPKYTD